MSNIPYKIVISIKLLFSKKTKPFLLIQNYKFLVA